MGLPPGFRRGLTFAEVPIEKVLDQLPVLRTAEPRPAVPVALDDLELTSTPAFRRASASSSL